MGLGLASSLGAFWLVPLAFASASTDADLPEEAEIPFEMVQRQVETQVRQRVIIRITPLSRMSPPPAADVMVERPRQRVNKDMERCIPIKDIAGVRLGQGRQLLLYMRDRRVVGTSLDRSCQVSSFYSGFYVERPDDGMLCAGREALHARSGADCMLGSFHEVQPGDDD